MEYALKKLVKRKVRRRTVTDNNFLPLCYASYHNHSHKIENIIHALTLLHFNKKRKSILCNKIFTLVPDSKMMFKTGNILVINLIENFLALQNYKISIFIHFIVFDRRSWLIGVHPETGPPHMRLPLHHGMLLLLLLLF